MKFSNSLMVLILLEAENFFDTVKNELCPAELINIFIGNFEPLFSKIEKQILFQSFILIKVVCTFLTSKSFKDICNVYKSLRTNLICSPEILITTNFISEL